MRDDDYRRWGDDPADRRALDAWLTRDPWADMDPVSVYTRQDAIADGVLVDATSAAQGIGLAVPAAFTSRAWGELGCADGEALRRVLGAVALALVMESRLRGRDVVRVELALRGPEGWVACWAAVDGDGLTVGAEGED
jgi:hypothetical protein